MIDNAHAPAAPAADPPAAADPAAGERACHVLVAEDNATNQMLAEAFLNKAGYTHRVVGDGRAAVDVVLAGGVDVVLMDCQMPVMDGYEATAKLHELAASGRLPAPPRIVALTANAMRGDRRKCLDAGMDGFVSKPINEEELVATIQQVLAAPPAAAAPAPAGEQTAAFTAESGPGDATHNDSKGIAEETAEAQDEKTPPAIDGRVLLERCMNMAELAKQILGVFAQSCRADLDTLAGAVGSGDLGQVTSYAHKIKGAAAQVAADRLKALAQELEQAGQGGDADRARALFDQLRTEADRCLRDAPRLTQGFGS